MVEEEVGQERTTRCRQEQKVKMSISREVDVREREIEREEGGEMRETREAK